MQSRSQQYLQNSLSLRSNVDGIYSREAQDYCQTHRFPHPPSPGESYTNWTWVCQSDFSTRVPGDVLHQVHSEKLILIQDPDFLRKLSPREEVPHQQPPPPSTHPGLGSASSCVESMLKVWGQWAAVPMAGGVATGYSFSDRRFGNTCQNIKCALSFDPIIPDENGISEIVTQTTCIRSSCWGCGFHDPVSIDWVIHNLWERDPVVCIFNKVTKRWTRVTEAGRNAAFTGVRVRVLARGEMRAST